MRISNLQARVTEYFFHTLQEQGSRSLNPQSGRPVLYLKCWGSDYPYLGVEQQKQWLPVVMDSPPRRLIRN
jgi:hypothetical protein